MSKNAKTTARAGARVGAGVGVGMLRGRGDAFIGKNSKCLDFVVSWLVPFLVPSFLGFLDSWIIGVLVSWFQSFKDSKAFNICWKRLIPYYQISISCFLKDIDPVFQISKNLLDGSSGCFGPAFATCSFSGFPTF